MEINMSGSENL